MNTPNEAGPSTSRIAISYTAHDTEKMSHDARFARPYNDTYSSNLDTLNVILDRTRHLVQQTAFGEQRHFTARYALSDMLRTRYKWLGNMADMEESITLGREALAWPHLSKSQHGTALTDLGATLFLHFQTQGDRAPLNESIDHLEQALRLSDRQDKLLRVTAIVQLSGALITLALLSSDSQALFERAIALAREGLECCEPNHPQRYALLNNLGEGLLFYFENHSSNVDDLEQAVALCRQAADLVPYGHVDRALVLSRLASALMKRWGETQQAADFEEGIVMHRRVVESAPEGHYRRFAALANLGMRLWYRFEKRAGIVADIEESVSLNRLALRIVPPHKKGNVLSNLALSLVSWIEHEPGRSDNIEEAITLLQETLLLEPPGTPGRSDTLHVLSRAYAARYNHYRIRDDLDHAVEAKLEALSLCGEGHHNHLYSLRTLAELAVLDPASGQQNIDDHLTSLRKALETIPIAHPERVKIIIMISDLHYLRFQKWSAPEDLTAAVGAARDAAKDERASVASRFKAASQWIIITRDQRDFRQTLEAYQQSLALLPRLALFGQDLTDTIQSLRRSAALADDAAACALCVVNPERAIELLEQGRGLFWQSLLELRAQFDDLPEEMARPLREVSHELEAKQTAVAGRTTEGEEEAAHRRRLNDRFYHLISQARRLPGFEHLLLPRSYSDLAQTAREGPVVIMLDTEHFRRGAIIIPSATSAPRFVNFPDLSTERLRWFATAVSFTQPKDHRQAQLRLGIRKRAIMPFPPLERLLALLWNEVVERVIQDLQLSTAKRTRLCWVPSGRFAFLPLHAAGVYDGPKPECASDYIVSSYSPTLSALLNAQQRKTVTSQSTTRVLLVAEPAAAFQHELPCAPEEVRKAEASILEGISGKDVLIDKETRPTKATVLEKMKNVSVLHLACHGDQSEESPLTSGFYLGNEKLTLSDIMKLHLPRPFLAFLSACESAAGDRETIYLAAAMQFVGFKNVIGTMWTMNDTDGPELAAQVYREIFKDFDKNFNASTVAYALDAAVRNLRESGVPANRWAPYIHIGP